MRHFTRKDLMPVDGLVVLARNVRTSLDDSHVTWSPHYALEGLDQLVERAEQLRPWLVELVAEEAQQVLPTGDDPEAVEQSQTG